MCDTWEESGCRPLIFSSIVVLVAPANTVIVPAALTPGSGRMLNVTPAGEGKPLGAGDGDGLVAAWPPQAPNPRAIATIATWALAAVTAARHRVPALPQQVTGRPDGAGWDCGPARPCDPCLRVMRGGSNRPAPRAPQQVPQAGDDDQRTDRPERGDDVVDGGHEVVGRVVESGGETPAVRRGAGRGRSGLGQGHRHGAVRGVVVEVLDLPLELLDLGGDLADLVLHGDDVVDVLGLGQEREHRLALSLDVGQPRAQVDVLGAD